jgi:hypothetical protein
MRDPGLPQLVAEEGALARDGSVAEQGQQAFQLARLDALVEAQQRAVPAVQRAREGPHVRELELLVPAGEPLARDPEDEGRGRGQERREAGVGGGERRGAGGMAGGIGGQVAPGRHQ